MALSDGAVILPGTGYFYIAPAETAAPADKTAPAAPWENLGHTSREDGMTITREGGDVTTLGTWQNPALRTRRDPTTYALTFNLHQIDNQVLELYFGGSDVDTAGVFGVPLDFGAITKALYVRLVDGADEVGLYIPKVEVSAEDDIEVDVEGFLQLPVRANVLGVTGSNLLEFYKAGLGAAV